MPASRKLFVAALLLAAGFGVALLTGEPAARWYASSSIPTARAPVVAAASTMSSGPSIKLDATAGARLVPDFSAANPYQVTSKTPLGVTAPALSQENNANGEVTTSAQTATVDDVAPTTDISTGSRAKLRNEAPRPLIVEVSAPAISEMMPATRSVNAKINNVEVSGATATWRTSGFGTAATITASYNEPVSPPPWPSLNENESKRTHIIIDGDSLAKLAGRYLDDPHRANDIYNANRELLANPDLLPIGAELAIPSRNSAPTAATLSPQSFIPQSVAIHTTSANGSTPVRPMQTPAEIIPRAHLSRPLPVE